MLKVENVNWSYNAAIMSYILFLCKLFPGQNKLNKI